MSDVEQPEKPKSKYTNRGGHGGPVGNQKGLKHGYYSLVRFIKKRGGALDKRTILGKMVVETVQQLEADLGGDLPPRSACSLRMWRSTPYYFAASTRRSWM